MNGVIRVKKVTGSIGISNNNNLSDIHGLSNIAGTSNQKLIIDDASQYDVKADSTKDFCTSSWDVYVGTDNISDDLEVACSP